MAIADEVRARCEGALAFTLYGGYAVHDGHRNVRFPAGSCIEKRSNVRGRCTYAIYAYPDGSRLEFRYSDASQRATLRTLPVR